ncbi:hypothetical protein EON62_00290, partial [archaeon]
MMPPVPLDGHNFIQTTIPIPNPQLQIFATSQEAATALSFQSGTTDELRLRIQQPGAPHTLADTFAMLSGEGLYTGRLQLKHATTPQQLRSVVADGRIIRY